MVGLDREREPERLARSARLRARERLLATLHGVGQRLGPGFLERREPLRRRVPAAVAADKSPTAKRCAASAPPIARAGELRRRPARRGARVERLECRVEARARRLGKGAGLGLGRARCLGDWRASPACSASSRALRANADSSTPARGIRNTTATATMAATPSSVGSRRRPRAGAGGGGTSCASGVSAPDSSAAAAASLARAMVALARALVHRLRQEPQRQLAHADGTAPRGTSGGTGSCSTRSRVMSG